MARPTLVSLANELGVSRQTISNVINAPHLVRSETRERVQAAIIASGYRPNVAAQNLRRQRSRTLAMRVGPTIDGINGAVMDRFAHALVQHLRRHGYNLMLVAAQDDASEVEQLRELAIRGTIDGCILTGTHADDDRVELLQQVNLAVATFGRPWGLEVATDRLWVDVDGRAGTRAATEHLLDKGCRRIGFLGWPDQDEYADDRRAGWSDAMSTAGMAGFEAWSAEVDDGIAAASTAAERLLDAGGDGFVCASDSLALGALIATRERGLPEPDGEVPVVGFDDTPVARALGISSVTQPVERCAELLVDALVAALTSDHPVPLSADVRLLVPELSVRRAAVPQRP